MRNLKIGIDILLLIATILLFEIDLIGNMNHEILGIALGILIIVHIGLNFKWIKQITRNFKKTNTKTKIMYVVDIFMMLIYFVAIICGMLISEKIFSFHMSSNLYVVLGHILFGRLAIIMMFVHLGLHLDRMLAKIKGSKLKISIYVIYSMIVLLIFIYLFYTLTHSFQWIYAFGK